MEDLKQLKEENEILRERLYSVAEYIANNIVCGTDGEYVWDEVVLIDDEIRELFALMNIYE